MEEKEKLTPEKDIEKEIKILRSRSLLHLMLARV
jgi:hypothetical protein